MKYLILLLAFLITGCATATQHTYVEGNKTYVVKIVAKRTYVECDTTIYIGDRRIISTNYYTDKFGKIITKDIPDYETKTN